MTQLCSAIPKTGRALLLDNEGSKHVRSDEYNYSFDKYDGTFLRWGATEEDDPLFAPLGPELLDIELSTGDCSLGCSWCYKSNSPGHGKHMPLEVFKRILAEIPKTVTQIAFGITDVDANPDFVDILRYTREQGIVPNYTMTGIGLTPALLDATVETCGAVAVSVYPDSKWLAYETVERLTDAHFATPNATLAQVNLHLLYHADNAEFVQRVLLDTKTVPQLNYLNAVVLLALKPVGRASERFEPMDRTTLFGLIDNAMQMEVPIGFDSCTAPAFEAWCHLNLRKDLIPYSESCESSLFSLYIDVDAMAWPCSFAEEYPGLEPIDMLAVESFADDVWYSSQLVEFRDKVLAGSVNGCRKCVLYELH